MTAEELAAALAAEQDGHIIVAHAGPFEEKEPFQEGENWLKTPLIVVCPATRAEYQRQLIRAEQLDDDIIPSINPCYTHFYRVVAAD